MFLQVSKSDSHSLREVNQSATEALCYCTVRQFPFLSCFLSGHTALVRSLAWSPRGDRLASAGDDQTVRVWDVARCSRVYVLEGLLEWVASLAWSCLPSCCRCVWERSGQSCSRTSASTGTLSISSGSFCFRCCTYSENQGRMCATACSQAVPPKPMEQNIYEAVAHVFHRRIDRRLNLTRNQSHGVPR